MKGFLEYTYGEDDSKFMIAISEIKEIREMRPSRYTDETQVFIFERNGEKTPVNESYEEIKRRLGEAT